MKHVADIMNEHPQNVKRMQTRLISATQYFTVLEMNDGEVFIETEAVDAEDITLCEVLRSKDRTHFTLVGRCRQGANHHEMRSYPRDNDLPLFSVVRLDAEPI